MKTYLVTFMHTQTSEGTLKIKANSQEEAEEMASNFTADQIANLNPVDGELSVESVELEEETK